MFAMELLITASLACQGQGIDLDRLLDLHTKARGGREAIESVDSLRVTLHLVEPEFEADLVYHAMRPGFARVDVSMDGRTVFTEAVDKTGAWQRSGNERVAKRSSPEGTAALRSGAVGNLYGLHELEDLGYRLRMLEPESIEGVTFHRIEATAPDGSVGIQYVDPGSCLVTRKRTVRAFHPDIDPTRQRIESLYSDFRMVDGIMRSFRSEDRDLDTGETLGETVIKRVEINLSFDPSMFDMPGAPRVENARMETVRLDGSLEKTIRRAARAHDDPAWIGYSVEAAGGGGWSSCCCSDRRDGSHHCGPCLLEEDSYCMSSEDHPAGEGRPRELVILARLRDGRVDRIRSFSDDCILDAGGRSLIWIEDVSEDDSLAWLSGMIEERDDSADRVLMAISMHAGERAIDLMIDRAGEPHPTSIRRKALFWLAHRAGNRVIGTLTEALDDEETAIKKAAVFGLSQLPPDEGIPLLIKVAREHRNLEVRRNAIFWLGQSRDPRAFDFIVGILKG